ncbi:type 1 glutamine amidotransferase domain-containing protein [Porphyrobacter sp. YT40]|uniref:type 1 glutamine amidotransferase domain-containing protein n=1 Tax=Porphyrobacter sp. YT40 TaxID=2547601 RepID=UPI001141811B|nr:type 1 glutamine amidotransferase domain-containing protein [Porphyrobacter sp. YT40]QDH35497.1 type 1 glutamine amidotransferase [Porphyrobacter sp. YT40]
MKPILIIATDGFEQSELMEPKRLLEEAGAETVVASLDEGEIKGWDDGNWGESVKVDMLVDKVSVDDYAALLLPGGQINPDILRMNDKVISLVREFDKADKPIAAICHAPWLLAEAGIIRGKVVTGWPSIRTDLTNAGGAVIDQNVAVDGNLITSRMPDDIPAFTKALKDAVGMRRTEDARKVA